MQNIYKTNNFSHIFNYLSFFCKSFETLTTKDHLIQENISKRNKCIQKNNNIY